MSKIYTIDWLTHDELTEHDRKLLKILCKRQDKYLERIPKLLDNRDLGLLLEENMDILRELSCSHIPDPAYIYEKTEKMLKDLKRLKFSIPCEPERTY